MAVGAAFRPKDTRHLQTLTSETPRQDPKHRPLSCFLANFARPLTATTRIRTTARLDRTRGLHSRSRLPPAAWAIACLDRLGRTTTFSIQLPLPAYETLVVASTDFTTTPRASLEASSRVLFFLNSHMQKHLQCSYRAPRSDKTEQQSTVLPA